MPLLVHLWRNDPIKDVRETAQDALRCFGSGDDATSRQMIDVTKILSDEVDTLRREVVAASERMSEVTQYHVSSNVGVRSRSGDGKAGLQVSRTGSRPSRLFKGPA